MDSSAPADDVAAPANTAAADAAAALAAPANTANTAAADAAAAAAAATAAAALAAAPALPPLPLPRPAHRRRPARHAARLAGLHKAGFSASPAPAGVPRGLRAQQVQPRW
ncbi:uncharacterized protein EKO05_0001424 [Ascochyta rabiei]|uniref:uncharacterized protein n=1 Tax=Didymella rabiei TaxID=5454 RepID=UPI0021FB84C6|nr:uncharacterized protein EKO05_0001424 [Ascochyta rabiei]UPX10785.1 hypothetical protein EKO05_0001424 [Ascochyta rabiei]